MINVDHLLYAIDQKLNKLASFEHQSISDEDKLIVLNRAQINLVKTKIGSNNIYGMGLDSFKKRYQDLQFLIENAEDHAKTLTLSDPRLFKYVVDISSETPKFMFYIDSYMVADKEDCKDRIIYCNPDLVKHADITLLLQNNNYKPSFEYQETFVDISTDELHYYTDGTFTPKKVYVSYLRYPKKIDKEGIINFDGSSSINQDCEFEDYLEEELLLLAVEDLAFATENQGAVQAAQSKSKTSE